MSLRSLTSPCRTRLEIQGRDGHTDWESESETRVEERVRPVVTTKLIQPAQMGEPTLKDVFLAVQTCNTTLSTVSNQFQYLREEVTIMHHDMQKVWERTSAVEG